MPTRIGSTWNCRSANRPRLGEYRFVRFAWKLRGRWACLLLDRSRRPVGTNGEVRAGRGAPADFRYDAGNGEPASARPCESRRSRRRNGPWSRGTCTPTSASSRSRAVLHRAAEQAAWIDHVYLPVRPGFFAHRGRGNSKPAIPCRCVSRLRIRSLSPGACETASVRRRMPGIICESEQTRVQRGRRTRMDGQPTEQALVEQAQRGDRAAFEQIVRDTPGGGLRLPPRTAAAAQRRRGPDAGGLPALLSGPRPLRQHQSDASLAAGDRPQHPARAHSQAQAPQGSGLDGAVPGAGGSCAPVAERSVRRVRRASCRSAWVGWAPVPGRPWTCTMRPSCGCVQISEQLKRSEGAVKLLLYRARQASKRCLDGGVSQASEEHTK